MLPLLLAAAAAVASGCLPVANEKITMHDLAERIPPFASAPEGSLVGYSPMPGTERVFTSEDLVAMARRFGVAMEGTTPPPPLCVAWPSAPLAADRLAEAAAKALNVDASTVTVLDWSRAPVPPGELVLPLQTLQRTAQPGAPSLWNGFVAYAGKRRFPFWIKLQVRASWTRVVATQPIENGKRITADMVRLEAAEGLPGKDWVQTLEAVAGKIAVRAFAQDEPLTLPSLKTAPDITRGDNVRVQVRCGAAQIGFDGIAEASGGVGDTVPVKNTSTNRTVRARVESAGTAVLLLPSGGSS